MLANIGGIVAAIAQRARAQFGSSLVWKGGTYSRIDKNLNVSGTDFAPAGNGLNAANAGEVQFELSPPEFAASVYPVEGDIVTDAGTDYTVVRVEVERVGNVDHSLLIWCYRTPTDDTTPSDDAQYAAFPSPP